MAADLARDAGPEPNPDCHGILILSGIQLDLGGRVVVEGIEDTLDGVAALWSGASHAFLRFVRQVLQDPAAYFGGPWRIVLVEEPVTDVDVA